MEGEKEDTRQKRATSRREFYSFDRTSVFKLEKFFYFDWLLRANFVVTPRLMLAAVPPSSHHLSYFGAKVATI